MQALRRALLEDYDSRRRELPWRGCRDPYRVLVAEVMLQQSQVATVAARYDAFLAAFPSLRALAAADVTEVCEAWAGLGYYARARNLHAAARTVQRDHGGRVPASTEQLRSLPGVGAYTAGAVASIAFGRPEAAVDGNVARVLARIFAIEDAAATDPCDSELWMRARSLVRGDRPGDLNQALMELGQLVCRPARPRCERCPASRWCRARADGRIEQLPRRRQRVAKPELDVAFAWVTGRGGLWLERRPLEGLWGGLWQPPGEDGPGARTRLARRLGVGLTAALATVRHELTHRRVTAVVYGVEATPRLRRTQGRKRWPEPLDAPLSSLARKAVAAVSSERVARARAAG